LKSALEFSNVERINVSAKPKRLSISIKLCNKLPQIDGSNLFESSIVCPAV